MNQHSPFLIKRLKLPGFLALGCFTFLAFLLFIPKSLAQPGQGFEGITTALNCGNINCYYTDPGSPAVQHLLVDDDGIPVTLIGSGTSLGFATEFTPTRTAPSGTDGLADGDAFGVAGPVQISSELGVAAPEGTQAFLMEDTDGWVTMYFDYVDLTGTTSPMMSMQYFAAATTWENSNGANDRLYIRVEIDNCASTTTITLLDTDGGGSGGGGGLDMDDGANAVVENAWTTLSANLTAYVGCRAQLIIEFDSESSSEEIGIDDVSFTEGTRQTFNPSCPDSDSDGVCDDVDICSGNDASGDSDGDGVCDDIDVCNGGDDNLDADGDGIANFCDACFGDNSTGDTDNDGICDDQDTPTISSSFEEPAGLDGVYKDLDDPQVAHFLVNHAGEPIVEYVYAGGELGFTSYFIPSRTYNPGVSGLGLTDGDEVGVTTETTTVGAFTDASQGFKMEDTDGIMRLYMDAVDLTGATSPTISVDYFLNSTEYEISEGAEDRFRIYVDVDNGTSTIDLINTAGSDIDALGIEGTWNTLSANLTVGTLVRLVVEADFNSATEELFVDNIIITGGGTVVPGPPCIEPLIDSVTASFSTICPGGSTMLSVSGFLNNATEWHWYSGSCGGTPAGMGTSISVTPGSTTTYYVRGEGACVGTDATCTAFSVTVEDLIPPVVQCPADITIECDETTHPDNTGWAAATDNCGMVTRRYEDLPFPGNCLNEQQIFRLWIADDASGNADTCVQTITVVDTTAPSITCPGDVTVSCITDVPPVDTGSPIASDNCGAVVVSHVGDASVGTNPATITRTYRATDACGNQSDCDQIITVWDQIPPNITCQDVTIELEANGEFFETGTFWLNNALVSGTDNCGGSILFHTVSGPNTYTCAHLGPNLTQIFFKDERGNQTSCFITATVTDPLNACNQPPVAICQDITLNADANCEANATATNFDGGSSDPDGDPLTFNVSPQGPYPLGTTNVVLTVDDGIESDTCHAKVTVVDNTAPSISCPADITVSNDAGQCGAVVNFSATVADNCSTPTIAYSSVPGAFLPVGITPVTATATDAAGNSSNCTFNITVNDNEAPATNCQDLTVQLDAAGDASITPAQVDNNSTDNCGVASLSLDDTDFTCADVGGNTVTLTVTDVNGNQSTCTATVTVEDNVVPIAICQDITVQLDANGMVNVAASQVDNGSSDACGIASVLLNGFTSITLGCSHVNQTNTTALVVTDVNGNSASCQTTITVEDNVAPDAQCTDTVVQLDGSGNGSITPSDVDNGSSDACGIASLSLDDTSFGCADVGSNTVTLTVTDVNGNQSTCTATVTVEDNVAPNAICMNATVQLDAGGNVSITPADVDGGSSDACGIASASVSPSSFGCYDLGDHTVVLTLVDVNGNSSNCTATVTVEGPDEDCDTVADICDECPGGDDTVDNNNDGLPDCSNYPGFDNLIDGWKCGSKKVRICHNGNTLCVSKNAVAAHMGHHDFVGPCDGANCNNNQGFSIPGSDQINTDLLLYPNPANNRIQIDFRIEGSENLNIKVINMQGAIQISTLYNGEKGWNTQSLDISSLAPGIYWLQIKGSKQLLTTRFIRAE